jgi:triacylglycerol lipase
VRPVILVPGWADSGRSLGALARGLERRGWPSGTVTAVSFRDRFGSSIDHAAELAARIDGVRAGIDGGMVDVVAHSMGGLAVRWLLLERGRAAGIDRVAFLGTPHRGTWAALLAFGAGRGEMLPESTVLRRLAAAPLPEGVRAACFWTPWDRRILPPASARLEGVPCHRVRTLGHRGLFRSRDGLDAVARFLLDVEPELATGRAVV